jgi:uncharacterized protein (TIGR02145 family)
MSLLIKGLNTDVVKVYKGFAPFCKIYHGSILKWWAADCQSCINYGYLYNIFVVFNIRKITSSDDWIVPEYVYLTSPLYQLIIYLGGFSVAGGKLKEIGTIHWNSPNTGATNEVGFNARGGAVRNENGSYGTFKNLCSFLTTTQAGGYVHFDCLYNYDDLNISTDTATGTYGGSIRLHKTSTALSEGQTGTYTGNDGKKYNTICINGVEWLSENLAETEYRDHSKIPIIENAVDWAAQTNGAMCSYNNDYTLVGCGEVEPEEIPADVIYGLLYNWYAVGDARNIAPAGWHVPSETEYQTLFTTLGGREVAGGYMKETGYTYWDSPNIGADNSSGFNGRASGTRVYNTGAFESLHATLFLLNVTPYLSDYNYWHSIGHLDAEIHPWPQNLAFKKAGMSIRLIKDDSTDEGTMKDNNGVTYNTVKIGDQVWMAENLKTTKYRNGDTIPEVTDNTDWTNLTTGALCAYANNWDNV